MNINLETETVNQKYYQLVNDTISMVAQDIAAAGSRGLTPWQAVSPASAVLTEKRI